MLIKITSSNSTVVTAIIGIILISDLSDEFRSNFEHSNMVLT